MESLYKTLFFLFFSLGMISAQDYIPSEEVKWRSLIGDVYIIPFFIDTDQDEWFDDEVDYYLNELNQAQTWILNQSKDYYNIQLEFIDDYFDSRDEVAYIKNVYWGISRHIKSIVMEDLGYDSVDHYLEFNNFDKDSDKVIMLFFVKQDGRSHAYDGNRSVFSKTNTVDHAIVYCNSTSGMITDYKTISHEMLHLFGAWDFYEGRPQNPTKARALKELYPNSVMLSTYKNDNPTLDEINAWRIGWNMNPQKSFMDYKPEYRKNSERMKKEAKKEKALNFKLGDQ